MNKILRASLLGVLTLASAVGFAQSEEKVMFKNVTSVTNGKQYLIVANDKFGTPRMAKPATRTDAYMLTQSVFWDRDEDGNILLADGEQYAFTFEATDGGFKIRQNDGNYLYADKESERFLIDAAPDTAAVWTATADEEGKFLIKNVKTEQSIQMNNTNAYGLFTPEETYYLPSLYEKADATGISGNVAADKERADAPLFNLAGQRVDKAAKGILIRNGKKFVNR